MVGAGGSGGMVVHGDQVSAEVFITNKDERFTWHFKYMNVTRFKVLARYWILPFDLTIEYRIYSNLRSGSIFISLWK